jgi:hypothetical protein
VNPALGCRREGWPRPHARSLLCRLASSVTPPGLHTIRYAGVLAAASSWRSRLAPQALPQARAAASEEPARPDLPDGYRPSPGRNCWRAPTKVLRRSPSRGLRVVIVVFAGPCPRRRSGRGSSTLRTLGAIDGPRWLDGRTQNETVGLAPTTGGVITGSRWRIHRYLPADVLTQHNDNARSVANLAETVLDPPLLRAGRFGRLFQHDVDGQAFAQPLYVGGLTVPGNGCQERRLRRYLSAREK